MSIAILTPLDRRPIVNILPFDTTVVRICCLKELLTEMFPLLFSNNICDRVCRGVRPFGVSLLLAGFDDNGPQLYQVCCQTFSRVETIVEFLCVNCTGTLVLRCLALMRSQTDHNMLIYCGYDFIKLTAAWFSQFGKNNFRVF